MAIPEECGDKQEHKGADRAGALVLPVTAAMQPLMGKPRKRGFVFSTAGGSEAFSGFSKAKRALDSLSDILQTLSVTSSRKCR
jgi:hypothetical protein